MTDAQPLAEAKHISLVVDLIDPPNIHADPHRISQVLSNLLGNAIKFTPEGGTVTLRARSRDGVLSVTIADTGTRDRSRTSRAHIRSLLATQGIGRRGNGARALHRAGNRGGAWRTRVGRVFSPRRDLSLHVAARARRGLSAQGHLLTAEGFGPAQQAACRPSSDGRARDVILERAQQNGCAVFFWKRGAGDG